MIKYFCDRFSSPIRFHDLYGAFMLFIRKTLQWFFLLGIMLYAETHITGDITGMTFESGGNPYIVEQDILVPTGNKAIIKEGCIFLFKPFTGLTVHGHLLVDGTQEQPVIFTSINDGEYNTASEQLPNPFDWNGILISRDAGKVSLKNFSLRFSVYGIKSQNPNIQIDNGLFRQNGQFHFTINDKIQFVQDNIPYSFSDTSQSSSKPDKPDVRNKPGDTAPKTSSGVKTLRYLSLSIGIAETITGVAFGITTAVVRAQWGEMNKDAKNYEKAGETWNSMHEKYLNNITGTIIGSSFSVLGFTGFGLTFLF